MSNVLGGRRPSYVSIKTLAAELEVGETQVYSLIRQGVLPKPLKLTAGCVRWSWSSVQAALASLEDARETDEQESDPYIKAIFDAKKKRQETSPSNDTDPIMERIELAKLAQRTQNAKALNSQLAAEGYPNAYSVASLARHWRCSGRHVRDMIKRGDIPHILLGKTIRIRGVDVEAYEKSGGGTNAQRAQHARDEPT